jgi:hypothetical protein
MLGRYAPVMGFDEPTWMGTVVGFLPTACRQGPVGPQSADRDLSAHVPTTDPIFEISTKGVLSEI